MSIFTLGVDIGSSASKAVILKDGRKVFADSMYPFGAGTSGPEKVMEGVFEKAKLSREEIAYTIVTGYGRFRFCGANKQTSELTCHAQGVHFLVPGARTVIDIGGQDAKVLQLDEKGRLLQFQMNDKCAAGTGRFLEVMARVLEQDIDQLGEISANSKKTIDISSICTVFAESEVISHLSDGENVEDIIAGIHRSISSRVAGLAKRVGVKSDVVLTGGVARNSGVAEAMSRELGLEVKIPQIPQLTGALGAALLAYKEVTK